MELLVPGLVVFAVAFAVAYAMVPVSKVIAEHIGALDYPGERRVNVTIVPRAGGIALYAGFLAGALTVAIGVNLLGWRADDLAAVRDIDFVLLVCGLSIVFVVGLIDDVSPMSPRSKLAGQVLGAAVICMSGVTIGAVRWVFTGEIVVLGWLDWPLTIAYFVIFMNIINLIDGLDGLAAGITAIVGLGLLYLVTMRGSFVLAMFCLALVASCLAFLRFNFHPASVFMGDSGALFLGALLSVISVSGVVRMQGLAMMLIPLVIAGVPLLDAVSATIRRWRVGRSIGKADMGHIHHRLVGAGLGQRRSVLLLYAFSAAMTFAGCTMTLVHGVTRLWLLAGLAAVVAVVVWKLHLFDPVLRHYYRRRLKSEKRRHITVFPAKGEMADAEEPFAARTADDAEAGASGHDGEGSQT